MHRTVINLKGTGESETDEIKQALEGQTGAIFSPKVPGYINTRLLLLSFSVCTPHYLLRLVATQGAGRCRPLLAMRRIVTTG